MKIGIGLHKGSTYKIYLKGSLSRFLVFESLCNLSKRVLQIPEIEAFHLDADMTGQVYTPPAGMEAKNTRPFPCPRRKMGIYFRMLSDRHLCRNYFDKTELMKRKLIGEGAGEILQVKKVKIEPESF